MSGISARAMNAAVVANNSVRPRATGQFPVRGMLQKRRCEVWRTTPVANAAP